MTDWRVLDAKCTVGRHLKLQAGAGHTADDLVGEMDHFGVWEALALDSLSRENHPADGNERILEVTADRPRLHPAWAALPTGAQDEQPEPGRFLEQMRQNKAGALWLFPAQYRFCLSDWCVDALLEPLAAARVPVFIDNTEIARQGVASDAIDWDAVVALCRRWPDLPVIVSEYRIRRGNRMIYRALEACENLHIELSGYWLYRGIEYITAHWGAHRLIFGSNWPHLGYGCTLATLTAAEIDDDAKRRIAGDTMRGLMAWCGPEHPEIETPPPADEFAAFARTGERPPELTFADCHGHLGGRACHYHLPDCSLDATVAEMDRLGVERCCVFSFTVVFGDEAFGNDVVAEAVARYPERFVGFTGLNPHRGERAMLEELERGARLGLRGIKLIAHYQGYPEEGPLIDIACQWAHERKQIILHHHWGSPEHVERLVSTYPGACFITGHATRAYADVMQRHPNLFVCSCPLHEPNDCENMVAAIGADRLLFGSDLQDLPVAWGLGPILSARLTREEKGLILGGNLRRILDAYSLEP
ncbi:MAG: amidohydrolase family protein [Candidatus Hydrogenedentes bacterium]|nr:amidohydrolase family protein [Candidatus Hydrogenedentota bacterium]